MHKDKPKTQLSDKIPLFDSVSRTEMETELNVEYGDLKGGYDTSKAARIKQWAEYGFQPYGNETKGASSIVDSTIFNSIEWMIPTLIQPFVQTDNVAELIPEGGDARTLINAAVLT